MKTETEIREEMERVRGICVGAVWADYYMNSRFWTLKWVLGEE